METWADDPVTVDGAQALHMSHEGAAEIISKALPALKFHLACGSKD